MRLSDTELMRLLPTFMRNDSAVKGLAGAGDIIIRTMAALIPRLTRWNQIDQLSESELDELAWELNISWYRDTASIETKRELVKLSDQVYSKLGTPWAVEQVVRDYFGTGEVQEWWEYGGDPYHFKVISSNADAVANNLSGFLSILSEVKRKSALLDEVLIRLLGQQEYFIGAIHRQYDHEIHRMEG